MAGSEVRRTIAAYDRAGPGEAARRRRQPPEAVVELRNAFVEAVRGRADAPPVLDLGCGGGPDLAAFRAAGCEAFGADPSARMAALARDAGPVVRADARALPFSSRTFDGVWASASLLHLPKRELPRALAEVHRVLRPGGLAYVSVREGDGERWTTERGLRRFFAYWRAAELDRRFAAASLKVTDARTVDDGAGRDDLRWLVRVARRTT